MRFGSQAEPIGKPSVGKHSLAPSKRVKQASPMGHPPPCRLQPSGGMKKAYSAPHMSSRQVAEVLVAHSFARQSLSGRKSVSASGAERSTQLCWQVGSSQVM